MALIAVEAVLGRVEGAGRLAIPDGALVLSGADPTSLPAPQSPNPLRDRRSRRKAMARQMLLPWTCLLASLGLASQQAWAGDKAVELIQARTEIPEERLLDVGIRLFDPGFPENHEAILTKKMEGVLTDLRRAEARFIPYQLMQTLQSSGIWGAVRVVPDFHIVDVAVSATILDSTGEKLKLKVIVQDARGKIWLKKKYKVRADYSKFFRKELRRDPFQSLYNRIANDIRKIYVKLDDDDVQHIREISRLRFASGLVPDAFGDYLSVKKRGRYLIARLPAFKDPMMARVASIRERDYEFVDTFQEYYGCFHSEMREPYDEWRERSFSRKLIAKKLGREKNRDMVLKTVLGAGIIAAGVVASAAVDVGDGEEGGVGDAASSLIMDLALDAGADVIEDAIRESQMHHWELWDLAQSINDGVAPVLVEYEGEVTRLTGSMEAQYSGWRELLRQIFAAETGLLSTPDVSIAPGSIISRRMASRMTSASKNR